MGWLIFLVLSGFSVYWFFGFVFGIFTLAFYGTAAIIALILGPKKFKHLPVRGWDPKKTRYSPRGIPYLED